MGACSEHGGAYWDGERVEENESCDDEGEEKQVEEESIANLCDAFPVLRKVFLLVLRRFDLPLTHSAAVCGIITIWLALSSY